MRSFGAAVAARRGLSEPSLAERIATFADREGCDRRLERCPGLRGRDILLDAGTTTGRVAAHFRERSNITVVTNGLTALSELSHADRVEVLVLGGRLRQLSQGLVGPLTDSSLGALTFNRIFLGADGLRADLGICEAEIEQTRTKELMASRADHVYVVADSSKLGARPFNAWARLKWYTLVTDDGATDEALEPFRNNPDIEVVLAPCNHLDVPGRSTLTTA